MSNGIEMELQFWTGFYKGDNCFEWASNKAYLDMNRTIIFKNKDNDDERRNWRQEVETIIKNGFYCLSDSPNFSKWHHDRCDEIKEVYEGNVEKKTDNGEIINTLSYGQAQKWLNMTLKYLWLLKRLGLLNMDDTEIIKKHEEFFDIPLDSYIIRYLANKYDIKCKISPEWSKIDNYDKYKEYQEQIKKVVLSSDITGYDIPLEWELEHWHKAISFYKE